MRPVAAGVLASAERVAEEGRPWAGLAGDALAFVLAQQEGSVLVVVDEADEAQRTADALRFFHPHPERVRVFPADDTRPYDGFSPTPGLAGERAAVLEVLDRDEEDLVVVAPARAVMQRVPDAATLAKGTLRLSAGDVLDRDDLISELTATGYLATSQVTEPGRYAVRGDVVDVWSAGAEHPVRLDFFDDEIESVRRMDPATQRTVEDGTVRREACILPAREERLDRAALARCGQALGRAISQQKRGLKLRRRVIEELRAGIRFSAVEDWLPVLVPLRRPLEAFDVDRVVVKHPASVAASLRDVWTEAHRRWEALDDDERPLVTPADRFVAPEVVLEALGDAVETYEMAGTEGAVDLGARPVEGFSARGTELAPVAKALKDLADKDVRVALVARDGRRADALEQLLEAHDLVLVGRQRPERCAPGEVSLLVGDLPRGFIAKDARWAFIPASAVFGGSRRATRRRAHDLFETGLTSTAELREDDPVVHKLHGIGRYQGLTRLEVKGGGHQDFVRLEYAGGDLLYLPVTALGDLSKYTASRSDAKVRLDRLGGATWERRKGKVKDKLLAKAQELLELHARREVATREPLPPPGALYRAFEQRFPYQETVDQAQAILDIHADLSADTPMDRLVCGDVGFGKTEVAMRAAMRSVEAGRQVAMLCPTTVLAFQHLMTFRERFDGLPVRIEMLSRFSTAKEIKTITRGLARGTIDIVVGTHKLLARSVKWAQLGLVIVDEEHRFGVRQKNRFRALRAEVDVLAMSATPIPRTLQMALSGLRTMSVMTTPPSDRLSVRTMVARRKRTRVRDAILLELQRGGQCFFVHNRIESLDRMRARLEEWVPEARIRTAHGQMSGEALEGILLAFMRREFDVLLSTAIIESGIDLPNVNTMLIDRADLFGLSQLYQIRGRVGRASTRGNCLLLTPEHTTRDARKRLQVLVENTQLGSGFSVAAADLELRGGGNLLGESQSGAIDKVGYETWVQLLEEAIAEAQGQAARERIEVELEVGVEAFLPEGLLPDMTERLGWYRKLSGAPTVREVEVLLDDLERERGDLPPPARNLGELMIVRVMCRELGLSRVDWLRIRTVFEIHPTSPLSAELLDAVVAEHPKRFAWTRGDEGMPGRFEARFTPREGERPLRYLRWVLAKLQRAVAEA